MGGCQTQSEIDELVLGISIFLCDNLLISNLTTAYINLFWLP